MNYKRTTQVPNFVLDKYLSILSESELKVLLVIIRQTAGWLNRNTGQRKTRDRILSSQFQRKTGYSRRVITSTIQSLVAKQLIAVTDRKSNVLNTPAERKGKSYLFYAVAQPAQITAPTCAQVCAKPARERAHNKTNWEKLSPAKLRRGFSGHIGEVIAKRQWR